MGLNFKKKTVVGVSVTPGVGIEVAHVDYARRILLGYVSKPFMFDSRLQGNFDLDIFKETLYDALVEIGAPQGTEVVLNLPSSIFGVKDYPASVEKAFLGNNVEDALFEHPLFRDNADEPVYSYCILPNSTIQFNKVVYTAVPKGLIMEIAVQIRDLKYNLVAIDTSVNSTLNALIYGGRVDVSPNVTWVMLLVEDSICRVITMQGRSYVDYRDESISIGDVLGEDDNYGAVLQAVQPLLKNIPSSLLYVISKTDVISAEKLASKLSYKAQIVHQEMNIYNKTPYLDLAFDMDPEVGKRVSLDVIGASVKKEFGSNSVAPLNMFNYMLGDIYTSQVPPVFMGIELSLERMIVVSLFVAVLLWAAILAGNYFIGQYNAAKQSKINEYNAEIASIDKFLKSNADVSANQFSETDEIRIGITENKNIYSYYTIVGTEIPKKLWLTSLSLGESVSIDGQADNLESVYSFFRNIKDYNPQSPIKLQKLGLAGKSSLGYSEIQGEDFDTESVMSTLNADFYEFKISDKAVAPERKASAPQPSGGNNASLPDLEPLE